MSIRSELGLNVYDKISCLELASHFDINVYSIRHMGEQGLKEQYIETLLSSAGKEFSAILLKMEDSKQLIYNCSHSIQRIRNSIAHEIAHVLCEHNFLECDLGKKFLIRDHPKDVEDEANWLSGCILMPGKGIEWAVRNKMSIEDMAEHFDVSKQLAQWRYNSTGMGKRAQYIRR